LKGQINIRNVLGEEIRDGMAFPMIVKTEIIAASYMNGIYIKLVPATGLTGAGPDRA